MKKVFFILLSLLIAALGVVIPAESVAARLASSPESAAPLSAQAEEEELLIEDILDELNLAIDLASDSGVREQVKAIRSMVRKLRWVELTGSPESALRHKYAIAEQLEKLIYELPVSTAATTFAAASAADPLYEELVRIRAKIDRLIVLETPPEAVPPPPPEIERPPEMERLVVYSAKFLCGPAFGNEGVQRGSYSTAINVHNPHNGRVYIYKKAVVANREDEPRGEISAFRKVVLGPDEAIEIDCIDIGSLLGPQPDLTRLSTYSLETGTGLTTPSLQASTINPVRSPIRFVKGFVVIYATAPVDVVAVYSASNPVGFSLDVEYLSPSTVTTLRVPPPTTEPECPPPCLCLTREEAVERGYTDWCEGVIKVCGYGEQQIERYCFSRPTEGECPDGCICLNPEKARELGYPLCPGETKICGYDDDEQQNPLYCYQVVTEEECPQGCICKTEVEAKRLGLSPCPGERIECGLDSAGNVLYCYERPSDEQECPQGCECLALTPAEAEKEGLVQCLDVSCGTDASGRTMYCYRKTAQVECPQGCECLALTPAEAEKKGLVQCLDVSCGTDDSGRMMYCYLPPEEEEDCPSGCVCLTELEAKRGGYSFCGGKRISCDYEPGTSEKWCYEKAVPARITIEPTQAGNPIGTTHTVTVRVYDAYGNSVANANVSINVNGANSYASGAVTTNSSGKAEFDYSGKNIGSDTIVATLGNLSATAFKEWYRK